MRSLLSILGEVLLELLFPSFCLGCGRFGAYLCKKCYASIYFYHFPPTLSLVPRYLDKVNVLTHYSSPIKDLIIAYKYRKGKILAQTLSELVWQSTILESSDLLTFIPLHPTKEKKRGFNQTQLLTQALAEKINIPWQNTLIKNKYHQAQAETTSKAERLNNVTGTFSIDPKFAKFLQSAQPPPTTVIIVDDVITTGSTLNEAARVLKSFGIKKVYGLALAHD